MHELTLARSLIELVDEYCLREQASRVSKINVRLGELSAMTRSLYFCFSTVAMGTTCEGAVLNIEEIPLTVFCTTCDDVKKPTGKYSFRCSDCGMPTPKIVTGKEMQLTSIELGDAPEVDDEAESYQEALLPRENTHQVI
jgi:hydrogenase nickel incorporation protein HypA/HybF